MAGGQQVLDHVRANVACTTHNQNFIQTSWKLLFTDAVNTPETCRWDDQLQVT
jgi:hypothetical protein